MLEEAKLQTLKKELIGYGTLVENMLENASEGLKRKDAEKLKAVIAVDEPKANELELHFDEACIQLIAQHQPAAKSLRTILMVGNISVNLERMADHVVSVSEGALYLIEKAPVKPLIDIPNMTRIVVGMIRDAITAFINEDDKLAFEICERDELVDGLRTQIIRELVTIMIEDPTTIERSLQLMKIASNLERIADLCTNIGEDVIYMVTGRVIKHSKASV